MSHKSEIGCDGDATAKLVEEELWRRNVKHAHLTAQATLAVLEPVSLDGLSKEDILRMLSACAEEEKSALRIAEMISLSRTNRFTPDEARGVVEAEHRVASRFRSLVQRLVKHLDAQHPGWSS